MSRFVPRPDASGWTTINWDDEVQLSAAERGHGYGDTDIIVGEFRRADPYDNNHITIETVRYVESHGCGGYEDSSSNPIGRDVELRRWRYAADAEIEAYETATTEEAI